MNVEDMDNNVLGAQKELMKYYNNISSNRWLMIKIFAVTLVFFFLFVVSR